MDRHLTYGLYTHQLKVALVRPHDGWARVDGVDAVRLLGECRARFGDGLLAGLSPDSLQWLLEMNARPVDTLAPPAQLDAIQACIETIVNDAIPGDLMEAGCFRGGLCVLMSGVLKALGALDRKVFAADSFAGLPSPDVTLAPDDAIVFELLHAVGGFKSSIEQFRETLRRHDLLDGRIQPIRGWFHETLPCAPIQSLAMIRLDATFQQSTRAVLDALYPKLSPGGFVFCSDYGVPTGARRAVDEYRFKHGIGEPLVDVDNQGVLWRKRAQCAS